MELKMAQRQDYNRIRAFYHTLIDAMADADFKPGWEKDVYPSRDLLRTSILNRELYYYESAKEICACMIVNHEYNEGYQSIHWSIDAGDDELLVIHALGVLPEFSGQGIAKKMVQAVFKMAKQRGMKTIRLDVLEGNTPAESVYLKMGFQYVSTLQMYYEDTGWTNFKTYEYLL